MSAPFFDKTNNIEWLRIVFALQVVFGHSAQHLGSNIPTIVGYFPGVPAFFFVSGFLIYASYLNAPGHRYFYNRFLRLFPGLLFVTLGAIAVALMAHGAEDLRAHPAVYALWMVAQLTLGQAYNPMHFRDVGVGVLNGALWTLTTEILFYLSLPLIVWLERRFRHAVLLLTALSFAIYAVGPALWSVPVKGNKTLFDFLALTPVVWGWMFGFGILAVKHFQTLRCWFRWFPLAAVPLAGMMTVGDGLVFGIAGNRLGLLYFSCYICLILWWRFQHRTDP